MSHGAVRGDLARLVRWVSAGLIKVVTWCGEKRLEAGCQTGVVANWSG